MLFTKKVNRCRTGVAVAGVLALGVMVGCGSDSGGGGGSGSSASGADKPVNIAMFLVANANTHQQAARKGAEAAIKEAGNAKLRVFGAEFDPKTQISQVEAAAASGEFDAFIINSVDGQVITPAITKALDADIKVVCGFAVCGPDTAFKKQIPGITAQVSADYAAIGTAMADALAKACEGIDPCKTVYIDGAPTLAVETLLTNAFNESIKATPNIEVVAHGTGEYLAPPAYKSMKDVLQANPDINAVVSPGDQMIDGAKQALDESPLKDKGVILIGDGASTLGAKGVADGSWYASAILRPFSEGHTGALNAINAVRGTGEIQPLVNSSEAEGIPELYISKDTVGEFKPEWPG